MSIDSLSTRASGAQTMRPVMYGMRHMASAGHYLAAEAAFQILEQGGNAVDAGVAAGITLGVVHSEFVNFAGVAPIMIYLAGERRVVTIDGLGVWPAAASLDVFRVDGAGKIPRGILRTVVPAAPDAWITALAHHGTLRFADVAATAVRLARDGFPAHPLMAQIITEYETDLRTWPSTAAIYLPNGRPPLEGERFVQADLAATIQYMIDEEAAAAGARADGLRAARDAFYKGDIARAIADYHAANGGLLSRSDLSDFSCRFEPPLTASFRGRTVYGCGPWCQGPSLLQMLMMADRLPLEAFGHNSPDYVHALTEAIKLAFGDREAHIGDPRFVDVPIDQLLSPEYADRRSRQIDPQRAFPGLPPSGLAPARRPGPALVGAAAPSLDTSYVAVVDSQGNAFSATPSDVATDTPVIPGTGLCPSSRGSQSWADPDHPASIAPGKRPRLTPNPAIVLAPDGSVMPIGTPGGDVQCQAMLQVLVNRLVFGMNPQHAVEAPRFASFSAPDSFEPHAAEPGRLLVEEPIAGPLAAPLEARGHAVGTWPALTWRAGGVCLVEANAETGVLSAGADPRRSSYAVGW